MRYGKKVGESQGCEREDNSVPSSVLGAIEAYRVISSEGSLMRENV